jgi:hypothetical protein
MAARHPGRPVTDKLRKIVGLFRRPRLTRELLALGAAGYLHDTGWTRSFVERMPVDADGSPVPWVTLPFIDFIGARIGPSMRVFEFGCGNSTLYYASRVASVTSVEHDSAWHAAMQARAATNVTLVLQVLEPNGDYARMALTSGGGYDLVIVDGRDRVNCVRHGIGALSDRGCLVLDDSERAEYAAAWDVLRDAGFRPLQFWGLAPGLPYRKCTTLFYRADNGLGL